MPAATMIQFTQEQARVLTGVSVETIRHWRRVVPHLAGKAGKSARFTFGDVVGLAVTHELISLGVRVASIGRGIEALFQRLAQEGPSIVQGALALVTTTEAVIVRPEDFLELRVEEPGLVVPLDPLLARIHDSMLPIRPAIEQAALPFLPQIARSGV